MIDTVDISIISSMLKCRRAYSISELLLALQMFPTTSFLTYIILYSNDKNKTQTKQLQADMLGTQIYIEYISSALAT